MRGINGEGRKGEISKQNTNAITLVKKGVANFLAVVFRYLTRYTDRRYSLI